jgi:hypothetical protein
MNFFAESFVLFGHFNHSLIELSQNVIVLSWLRDVLDLRIGVKDCVFYQGDAFSAIFGTDRINIIGRNVSGRIGMTALSFVPELGFDLCELTHEILVDESEMIVRTLDFLEELEFIFEF